MAARVYLIGAGPGDPGLITARGLHYLEVADVIIYDHLVHAKLLRRARPDAEKIDVGLAAPRPLEQEAISYLLAEKARDGRTVARLKWGDPFVFDSGGPEALFLHEQGVPFEVVPGVPVGIAAPAYAGIPITYPGGGDTICFIRGHEDDGKTRSAVDWSGLARLDGTIVCYAGPHRLHQIVTALLSHGRPPGDSAAVIYDGTLPAQETRLSTLEEVAKAASKGAGQKPGVLVVGRVAGLREHLRWFDVRPLFGRRVLVTRPRDQASELVDRLEALGAEAVETPMVKISPPDDYGPLDAACRTIGTFDWVVFASANAVEAFVERLLAGPHDLRDLKGVKLCAVGPSTAERLARHGLKVDLTPADATAEAIAPAILQEGDVLGRRILMPHADIGRGVAAEDLRRAGADVTDVVAYRTGIEPDRSGDLDIYRMLLERRLDAVTFTSPSAVRSFVNALGTEPAADLLRATVVACIGPTTSEAAARCDIRTTVMPPEHTVQGLVDALVEYYRRQQPVSS
jgi:uroporphyrinogen III methyltransferase/synthase